MKIFTKVVDLNLELDLLRQQNKIIGFVPTMGSLHDGHISLINACSEYNDITVVSIFVNPTQFNNANDLKNYPRNIDKDLSILQATNTTILFFPDNDEMYPEKDERVFKFDNLENILEGAFRPGHFNGVAQIVSKLFNIVKPNNAYFGQKDFQQLTIIKKLVTQLNLNINIVACETFRESDGLAMSSRNLLLSDEYRAVAPKIYKYLKDSALKIKNNSIEEIKKYVIENINSERLLKVEYFEIVNTETLSAVDNWDNSTQIIGCIAVFAGNIRLIDNIRYN